MKRPNYKRRASVNRHLRKTIKFVKYEQKPLKRVDLTKLITIKNLN